MKVEPPVAAPIPLARAARLRTPAHPRGGDFRHEVPTHAPEVLHVDALDAADPDSHEPPDFDEPAMDRLQALATARDVSAELAGLDLAIANHQAARVLHLLHP